MKRAAIYARFSSDRQRDRSIDDQVALCQTLTTRNGWTVTAVYADYAASGSTMHRRPEFSRMLADAEDRLFDVLIAEDIDRLARGEGDAPKLRQRLEFLGIDIHTCTDGHITKRVKAELKLVHPRANEQRGGWIPKEGRQEWECARPAGQPGRGAPRL